MHALDCNIENLVNKYGDTVYRLAFSYMKSKQDAEDVSQDVFIKLFEYNGKFENEKHEKLWIMRVTSNICKNKLKLFWRRNICSIDEVQEHPYYDEYSSENLVYKSVISLPAKYSTVIHLFYYEGYKTTQIAVITGQKESTVRSLLHRAREKLKPILKEMYDFE